MFSKFIVGNEKAVQGGLAAGVLTLLSLVSISGQMTVKEAVAALVNLVLTHGTVWITSNTTGGK